MSPSSICSQRMVAGVVLFFAACLVLRAKAAPLREEDILTQLHWPSAGQWVISGKQIASPIEPSIESIASSEEAAPGSITNQSFSSIVTFHEDKYSVVFREDSEASFAQFDCYWDGSQFSTADKNTQNLHIYRPGEKLDFPYDFLRYSLLFGHVGVRDILTKRKPEDRVSISPLSDGQSIILSVVSGTPLIEISVRFQMVESKLIAIERKVLDENGVLLSHWKNFFASPLRKISDIPAFHEAFVSMNRINANRYVTQVHRIQWITDTTSPDAFMPPSGRAVMVSDCRLSSGDVFYVSDSGAVSLEMLLRFSKDPSAVRAFEKEVYERTSSK